jgi:tRNA-2-methylthio-N6-dimethylallyladenosine synthase
MTFGCQMNASDSEVVSGLLAGAGYDKAPHVEDADVVIILTCSVRESAESRVHGRLGALKALKARRPGMIIGVGGCMPQREGGAREIMGRHKHVDLVFGTHNLHDVARLVEEARAGRTVEVLEDQERPAFRNPLRQGDLLAWVPIMHGCDNYCSYCIVPYVRGRPRSRPSEVIEAEVRSLVAGGCREITLLGQNVNAYGHDLPGNAGFSRLLGRLDAIEGLWRIRYTTSHPRDFDLDMVKAVAASRAVCEHFHLPVQSGSNRVLTLMNRGYTRERYLDLAAAIRERIPGASITTDIIVGFPGETQEDFEDTLDLVKRVGFDSAFTFMFSPRSGTPAATMESQVPLETRKSRLSRLIETQKAITLERNLALVGKKVEVLVEGPSKKEPERLQGRTRTGRYVHFVGPPSWKGSLVGVVITRAGLWSLDGERSEKQP